MSTTNPRPMAVAAYERCSQNDADPQWQTNLIDQWATKQGVPYTHYRDIGGRRHEANDAAKRPDWQRLMADCKRGKFTHLVVADTSRLGFRDEWELLALAAQLRTYGAQLIEAKTGRCLNGSAITDILGTSIDGHHHARHVRDLASNTLQQKMGYSVATGAWQGGNIVHGMRCVCRRPDGQIRWSLEVEPDGTRRQAYSDGTVVNHPADYFPSDRRRKKEDAGQREHLYLLPTERHPERLAAVRLVYQWFLTERVSPSIMAERLTRLGHRPPGPAESRWYHLRILRILESPVYTGRSLYGRRTKAQYHMVGGPGSVVLAEESTGGKVKQRVKSPEQWQWSEPVAGFGPPIVAREDWQRAQDKLAADRGGPRRPKSDRFLLSGLVHCGHCGDRMAGCTSDGRIVYRCSSYIRRVSVGGVDTGCGPMDVNQVKLLAELDAWVEQQSTGLEAVVGGDQRVMLRWLYDERARGVDALREAKRRVEEWLAGAIELVADPVILPDGRKRYDLAYGRDGESYVITLPGCESLTDLMAVYSWIESAANANARGELERLEADHERLTNAFMLAPTPLMRDKITGEARRVEAELVRARAGGLGLTARVRGLSAELQAQSQRLVLARRELKGSEPLRRAQLYKTLVERVTVRHERGAHGKRTVWRMVDIEVTGRPLADEAEGAV